MADILGNVLKVNQPVTGGYDNNSVRNNPIVPTDTQIQNVVDPSKVVRADGQGEAEGKQYAFNYESNYENFTLALKQMPQLTDLLSKLFFTDAQTIVTSGMGEHFAEQLSNFMELFQMEPEQILDFLKSQESGTGQFGGVFFQAMRDVLNQTGSLELRTNILDFLKHYSDMASGDHLMRSIASELKAVYPYLFKADAGKLSEIINRLIFPEGTAKEELQAAIRPGAGQAEGAQQTGKPGAQAAGRPGEPGSQAAGRPGEPGSQAAGRPGEPGSQAAGRPGEPGAEAAGRPGEPQTEGARAPWQEAAGLFKTGQEAELAKTIGMQIPKQGEAESHPEGQTQTGRPEEQLAVRPDQEGSQHKAPGQQENQNQDGQQGAEETGAMKDTGSMRETGVMQDSIRYTAPRPGTLLETLDMAYQQNSQVMKEDLIPFFARYISRTHDFGRPREILTMLTLNVARYCNGSKNSVVQSFEKLFQFGDFNKKLGDLKNGDIEAILERLLREQDRGKQDVFTERFLKMMDSGLKGEGGHEAKAVFQNVMNAMLLNESVYMPLLHLMLPVNIGGNLMFSELWVDPDAQDGQQGSAGEGRSIRMLVKFDIKDLGYFDMVLNYRDGDVDLLVAYPPKLSAMEKEIKGGIAKIVEENGLSFQSLTLEESRKPIPIMDVFPKISEGRNSINVRI